MRKFLAGLLAVLMLASVLALSVGAAETTIKTFDKTTKEDAGKIDLVITEIMPRSTSESGADMYEYIELYNRGTKEIDLSNYCLLRGTDYNKQQSSTWRSTHKFENVINLVAGSLFDDPAVDKTKKTVDIVNPDSIKLQPGEFAVIWIWNDDDENYCAKYGENLAAADTERLDSKGKIVSFPNFRDAYSQESSSVPTQNEDGETVPTKMSDDVLVLAAMGSTASINTKGFRLANDSNFIYAVAEKSMGQNILTHDAVKFTNEIVCMFHWGFSTSASIPQIQQPGLSTIYVPADQTPYLVNESNRLNAKQGETYKTYTDYVERDCDVNFETSYKEMAVFTWWEVPTPGYMMPYQWIYVDNDRMPDSAKSYITEITYENNDPTKEVLTAQMIRTSEINPNWEADMYAFLKADKLTTGGEGSGEGESKREEIDFDKIQQDKLRDQLEKPSNVKPSNTNKGLKTWVLILIIVGGVVVVAGIAVTVILVLKKKNKPVAADDVAAEGEVEIIDEGAGEEKPEENNSDETKSE